MRYERQPRAGGRTGVGLKLTILRQDGADASRPLGQAGMTMTWHPSQHLSLAGSSGRDGNRRAPGKQSQSLGFKSHFCCSLAT